MFTYDANVANRRRCDRQEGRRGKQTSSQHPEMTLLEMSSLEAEMSSGKHLALKSTFL